MWARTAQTFESLVELRNKAVESLKECYSTAENNGTTVPGAATVLIDQGNLDLK